LLETNARIYQGNVMSNLISNNAMNKITNIAGGDNSNGAAPRTDAFASLFQILSNLQIANVGDLDSTEVDKLVTMNSEAINALDDMPSIAHLLPTALNDIKLKAEQSVEADSATADILSAKLSIEGFDNVQVTEVNGSDEASILLNELHSIASELLQAVSIINKSDRLTMLKDQEIASSDMIGELEVLEQKRVSEQVGFDMTTAIKQKDGQLKDEVASFKLDIVNDTSPDFLEIQKQIKIFAGQEKTDLIGVLKVDASEINSPEATLYIDEDQFSFPVKQMVSANFAQTDNENVISVEIPKNVPNLLIVAIEPTQLDAGKVSEKPISVKIENVGQTISMDDMVMTEITNASMKEVNPDLKKFESVYREVRTDKEATSKLAPITSDIEMADLVGFKDTLHNLLNKQNILQNNERGLKNLIDEIRKSSQNLRVGELVKQSVRDIIKGSLRNPGENSTKASLFVSTAYALANRDFGQSQNFSFNEVLLSDIPNSEDLSVFKETQFKQNSDLNTQALRNNGTSLPRELTPSLNLEGFTSSNDPKTLMPQSLSTGISTANQLSLLDAQFASRLAAISIEQALKGGEVIELNLEPKSFGKLQVNATLEAAGLDVKLVAENSATISILRGSEHLLNNITEQYGLKLSQYSVDIGNGGNGNHQSNNNEEHGSNANTHINPEVDEIDTDNAKHVSENHLLNLIA
jgi:hypothetical protein